MDGHRRRPPGARRRRRPSAQADRARDRAAADARRRAGCRACRCPGKYVAAKLARGVPALAGEPIPLPVAVLTDDAARSVRRSRRGRRRRRGRTHPDRRSRTAVSTPGRCSRRRCRATRTPSAPARCIAAWRPISSGWSPSSPSVRSPTCCSERCSPAPRRPPTDASRRRSPTALDDWNHGYCPACGSWPAMAEVVDGHRVLRCSFCAAAWELTTYACVYCGEDGRAVRHGGAGRGAEGSPRRSVQQLQRLSENRGRLCAVASSRCSRSAISRRWISTWPRWSTATSGRRSRNSASDCVKLTTEVTEAREKPVGCAHGFASSPDVFVSVSRWLAQCAALPASASRCRPDSCSMSLCRLLPCASIVTIAGKSLTVRCHIASGVPNSSSETPSTRSIVRA